MGGAFPACHLLAAQQIGAKGFFQPFLLGLLGVFRGSWAFGLAHAISISRAVKGATALVAATLFKIHHIAQGFAKTWLA